MALRFGFFPAVPIENFALRIGFEVKVRKKKKILKKFELKLRMKNGDESV